MKQCRLQPMHPGREGLRPLEAGAPRFEVSAPRFEVGGWRKEGPSAEGGLRLEVGGKRVDPWPTEDRSWIAEYLFRLFEHYFVGIFFNIPVFVHRRADRCLCDGRIVGFDDALKKRFLRSFYLFSHHGTKALRLQ